MKFSLRSILVLSVSALALTMAPIALNGLPLAPDMVAMAGNGNGNGGGGDSGNGGGNGGGNSDHGGGGGNGNSAKSSDSASTSPGSNGNGRSKKSSDTVQTADTDEGTTGKRSLNAELGGLNSLKRNINGLMNSSDPRMEDIREFIVASAEYEGAKADLDDANEALLAAQAAYLKVQEDAGFATPSLDLEPDDITDRIGEIEAEIEALDPVVDADAIAELEEQRDALADALGPVTAAYDDLTTAENDFTKAEDAVAELADDTSPEALEDALRAAANRNRDVNDEVVAWASEQLGVGDADGLIDDYIESQN